MTRISWTDENIVWQKILSTVSKTFSPIWIFWIEITLDTWIRLMVGFEREEIFIWSKIFVQEKLWEFSQTNILTQKFCQTKLWPISYIRFLIKQDIYLIGQNLVDVTKNFVQSFKFQSKLNYFIYFMKTTMYCLYSKNQFITSK